MQLNWKKLYEVLDQLRQDSGNESWRSLAVRHGVTPSLFTRVSQGKPTSVKNLLSLLKILDGSKWTVKDFVEEKKGKK